METKRDGIESQFLTYIGEAQREYDELAQKEAEISKHKSELEDTIDSLKKALQFHLAKTGKEEKGITSEFATVTSAREATHLALQKYGEMDKQQLKDALERGGFKFGKNKLGKDKKPIPAIHFALVGDPRVAITERGTYEWIGNGKPKVAILSLPKGIIKFFIERNNEPASIPEVLEGIKKLGVRTTTKDLKGNVEQELMYSNETQRTEEGKYKLKQAIYDTMKMAQP